MRVRGQARSYSHPIVNKPRKASSGTGFPVVSSVNTMKNTIVYNFLTEWLNQLS